MKDFNNRLERIRKAVEPGVAGLVTFIVDGKTKEDDFERQKAAFLAKGGNPNSTFIMLIDRF